MVPDGIERHNLSFILSPVMEAGLLEERERERSEVRYKHLKSFMCLRTLWSFIPTQLIQC